MCLGVTWINSDLKRSGGPSRCKILCCLLAGTTTRMTGIESPGWRLFTDGGSKRQVDGGEFAGWRLAAASPDNFVRFFVAQFRVIPSFRRFEEPLLAATTHRNSLVLPKPFDGLISAFLAANACGSSVIPNTRYVAPLVLLMLRGTLPWPTNAMS